MAEKERHVMMTTNEDGTLSETELAEEPKCKLDEHNYDYIGSDWTSDKELVWHTKCLECGLEKSEVLVCTLTEYRKEE